MDSENKIFIDENETYQYTQSSITSSTPSTNPKMSWTLLSSQSNELEKSFSDEETSKFTIETDKQYLSTIKKPRSFPNYQFSSPLKYEIFTDESSVEGNETLTSEITEEKNCGLDEVKVVEVPDKHTVLRDNISPKIESEIYLSDDMNKALTVNFEMTDVNKSARTNEEETGNSEISLFQSSNNLSQFKSSSTLNCQPLTSKDFPTNEEKYLSSLSISFASDTYATVNDDWGNYRQETHLNTSNGESSDLERTSSPSLLNEVSQNSEKKTLGQDNCDTFPEEIIQKTTQELSETLDIFENDDKNPPRNSSVQINLMSNNTCILNDDHAVKTEEYINVISTTQGQETAENTNLGLSEIKQGNLQTNGTQVLNKENISGAILETQGSEKVPSALQSPKNNKSTILEDPEKESRVENMKIQKITDHTDGQAKGNLEEGHTLSNPARDFENMELDIITTTDDYVNTSSVLCMYCRMPCFQSVKDCDEDTVTISELPYIISNANEGSTCSEADAIEVRKDIKVLLELFEVDNSLSRKVLLALSDKFLKSGATETDILDHIRDNLFTSTVRQLKLELKKFFKAAVNAEIIEKIESRYFFRFKNDINNDNASKTQENEDANKRKRKKKNDASDHGKDAIKNNSVKKIKVVSGSKRKSATEINRGVRLSKYKLRSRELKTIEHHKNKHVGNGKQSSTKNKILKSPQLRKKNTQVKTKNAEMKNQLRRRKDVKTKKKSIDMKNIKLQEKERKTKNMRNKKENALRKAKAKYKNTDCTTKKILNEKKAVIVGTEMKKGKGITVKCRTRNTDMKLNTNRNSNAIKNKQNSPKPKPKTTANKKTQDSSRICVPRRSERNAMTRNCKKI